MMMMYMQHTVLCCTTKHILFVRSKLCEQVLQMERMILRTLAFDVSSPTANWFCLSLLREVDASEKACFLTLVDSFLSL